MKGFSISSKYLRLLKAGTSPAFRQTGLWDRQNNNAPNKQVIDD
jgi:hypothetical protein